MRITLCPGCHRHVKAGELICPFCQATMAEPPRPVVGAALAVGLGLAVTSCFGVVATAGRDAGIGDTGGRSSAAKDSAAKDAGVAPDAVFVVPYGTAPAWDSGKGDAGLANDAATRDATHDTARDTAVPPARIDIVVTDATRACTTNEDCTAFLSGKVCNTDCWKCEDETIPMNTSAAAKYRNELAALPTASCRTCGEVYVAPVACLGGECNLMVAAYKPPPPHR